MTEYQEREVTEKALRRCLGEVPFLEVETRPHLEFQADALGRPDVVLRVTWPKGEKLLLVEVKSSGQPKPVREAANQLLRYLDQQPQAYGIVVAPYISPTAADICIKEGIGYADQAGNCHLLFGTVYIHREGLPNPFARQRKLTSIYSPRSSRILRVLLVHTGEHKTWKLADLATAAEVSLGQVANVKKLLLEREWIKETSQGLVVSAPQAMLNEWAQHYPFKRHQTQHFYALQPLPEFEHHLARVCRQQSISWALTGFSAAARQAPMVRQARVMAYVSGSTAEVARATELKPVGSGANVTLLEPYDAGVYYGAKPDADGLEVVAPVQLYLDLLAQPGRGEEAANAVRQQVLEPAWK